MKIGIMQPYFFPYLGYFDLINRTDKWIVFDTSQYIRHGWINRNRILHPENGWLYIIVPLVKHDQAAAINRIEIATSVEWRDKIIAQLMHYKKRAPFFRQTIRLVEECMQIDEDNLSRLNTQILGKVCQYLGIGWSHEVFSKMQMQLGSVQHPGDWALRISEALGAGEYINPPGGADLFNAEHFAASGVKLTIQEPFEFRYACPGYQFEPALSVVDALMWNDPQTIKSYLDSLKQAY
jgi:hypothetical protein